MPGFLNPSVPDSHLYFNPVPNEMRRVHLNDGVPTEVEGVNFRIFEFRGNGQPSPDFSSKALEVESLGLLVSGVELERPPAR